MPGISEKPVSPDTLLSIKRCAKIALKVLAMEPRQSTPSAIVTGLDEFVSQWQKGVRPDPSVLSPDDVPLVMGSLWGEAMVSRFSWQWAMVMFHDHGNAIAPAVVSPDRAVAIYPLHHLTACFVDSTEAGIVAAYNILKAGTMEHAMPGAYADLMESARRAASRA